MKLKYIIANYPIINIKGKTNITVNCLTSDSRMVKERGAMFIAIKGEQCDGHQFIAGCIQKGAEVIVYQDEAALKESLASLENSELKGSDLRSSKLNLDKITFIRVSNSRECAAIFAANYYDNPSKKLQLVGITGTNGKTTIASLLYSLFMLRGYSCGLLSTIANYVVHERFETENTTSDPITINRLLAQMVERGCQYCFMEVSSIGIEQSRLSGLHFRIGIFSNLSHDHLDYHKTFGKYLRCKKLFFDDLSKKATAITNLDDKNGLVMVQNCKAKIISYSCHNNANHRCRIIEEDIEGMLLEIDGEQFWTKLIGQHNAYNILAIYSCALELGFNKEYLLLGISKLDPVKGRLEIIRGAKQLSVIIDYAHSPDALENVLTTLKRLSLDRELVCVFGCGGDRDKGKRSKMAAIAETYCNKIIVTSDNSRSERSEDIFEDIKKGFSINGLSKTLFISDRKEAIRTAILISPPKSIILLAGKGHETYQIIAKEKKDFDERVIVKEIFNSIQ